MKAQIRVSYTVWQEGMTEAEAMQVVMEGVPDNGSHIKAEVVNRVKNPVELQPVEEKTNETNQHSTGAR